jgi:hypothetical protein
VRALSITITSSESGTGMIGWELGFSTVLVHFYEIEGTVKATWKLRHIDIKSELSIQKHHWVIVVVILH